MKEGKGKKKRFRWWKIPIIIVAVPVVIAGSYAAYLLITYDRIEDNLPLEVYCEAQAQEVQAGKEYTAVTYNIGFGAYTPDFTFFMDGGTQSWANSKESVIDCTTGSAQLVKSLGADIVFLQEVDDDSTRSYHVDQTAMYNEAFIGYDSVFARNSHSAFLAAPPLQPHGFANSGLLTMADFSLTESLRRSLPISESFSKIFDLDRCYSVSRSKVDNGKELVLINLHLSAYGTDGDLQTQQMTMLFDDMKKEYDKGNYVITAGDFNHDFTVNSKDVFNDMSRYEERTWAADFPDEMIPEGFMKVTDYKSSLTVPSCRDCDIPYCDESFTVIVDGFMVSDNITPTYVDIVDNEFLYSDHNPVVMKFKLK